MRSLLKFSFITVAIVVIILAFIIYMTRPVINVELAAIQANKLIAGAGGPAIVCDEASQMFKRFGVSKVKFIEPSELKDFPAIAALGNVDGIWPGTPPHISIRVGTHINGFFIEIADTNSPVKYVKSHGTIEVVDSCVFVHR